MRPLVVVFALFVPCSLHAQQPDCADPHLSMVELGGCMDSAYARADRELNAAYRAATAALVDAAQRTALLQSERAWLAFRDAQVALRRTFAGGNHPSMEVLPSLTAMVESRARFLRALAADRYPAPEKACQ